MTGTCQLDIKAFAYMTDTCQSAALTLDEPGDVRYDATSRTITFKSPSTFYCARVTIFDGVIWQVYVPCAPTMGGSIKVDDGVNVEKVRVSLCLERRLDVCSLEIAAEASTCEFVLFFIFRLQNPLIHVICGSSECPNYVILGI